MLIFNLGNYYLTYSKNFGVGISPHLGILAISGLLFGPYGAFGCVVGNILCDIIRGYSIEIAMASGIVSFGISYLVCKLWYTRFKKQSKVTRPKLNTTSNVCLLISILFVCGLLYAVLNGQLFYLFYKNTIPINYLIECRYFLNFINASFIFGIIGIWFFNKIDFIYTPKTSSKDFNERAYNILEILLIASAIISLILSYAFTLNTYYVYLELIIISLILFIYLTKPITAKIEVKNAKSIPEKIMNIFQLTILFIIILGIIISYDHALILSIADMLSLSKNETVISMIVLMDILLLIFLIPSLTVLRHVETNVIDPILSFSEIKNFIHENQKIESEGLLDIYSKYINEETEIGILARSYTDLITFNNNYIENIHEIEGEKERIKAELEIATKIQAANLPTEPIIGEDYIVNGYSQPAKEVGGDFFDYYELDDDNLAIVIGDASGKGVPAAILAMITQVLIKQLLKTERDPSKVLYQLNNQLFENNPEAMFISLWLGIYNKNAKTITFSNAGHNPPLIKNNSSYSYLDTKKSIVIGIIEDFEFVREEIELTDNIILYTDGITDANNEFKKMYGEKRLLNFFNNFNENSDPIKPLLKDIHNFTQSQEQYDDMTVLYLRQT